MIKLTLIASFLFSSLAWAESAPRYFYDKDLPYRAPAKIKILAFDKRLDGVFQAIGVKQQGEGEFYTRLQYLAKASKKIKFKDLHKHPDVLVGRVIKLDKDLVTVLPPPIEEVEKFKKKSKKKRKKKN